MKTYLFDFDGTLVDSMPTFVSTMLSIMDEANMPYDKNLVRTITPLGLVGTAKYFKSLGHPYPIEEMLARIKVRAFDAYANTIPAKPHVTDALRTLRARGDSLHVLTASPHITLDLCLKRLGLYDMFENVWSCDDFETTKSDPAIYLRAANKIGKDVSEILFLDDNLNANLTAKKAGMKVCGVFDESSAEYEAEIRRAADFYIYDFSALPDIEF